MSEQTRKMICQLCLRPRVAGVPEFIEAGKEFDESIIDEESKASMLKNGLLKYVAGPVAEEPVAEEPVAEEPVAEEPVAEEPVAEELVKELPSGKKSSKKKAAPKGIFKDDPADLKDFNLDELDARHAQICAENKLPTPEPFKTVGEGIAKLTGN